MRLGRRDLAIHRLPATLPRMEGRSLWPSPGRTVEARMEPRRLQFSAWSHEMARRPIRSAVPRIAACPGDRQGCPRLYFGRAKIHPEVFQFAAPKDPTSSVATDFQLSAFAHRPPNGFKLRLWQSEPRGKWLGQNLPFFTKAIHVLYLGRRGHPQIQCGESDKSNAAILLRNSMEPECLFRVSSTRGKKWRGRGRVDFGVNTAVDVRIACEGKAHAGFNRWFLQRNQVRLLVFDDLRPPKGNNQ